MQWRHKAFRVVPLVGVLVLAGCAASRPQPTMEWDGLVRQPNAGVNLMFLKPDADIRAYRSILLDPVEIRFARDWDPNRGSRGPRRIGASDADAIKTSLADMFRTTLGGDLERAGYQLVDQVGPETLRVSAAIIDLSVTAPDAMTPGMRTYTANSGRMTLVLEVRDSISGEVLARVVDVQSGRSAGVFTVTTRATNLADAQRAINVWSAALGQALNTLYAQAPASAT